MIWKAVVFIFSLANVVMDSTLVLATARGAAGKKSNAAGNSANLNRKAAHPADDEINLELNKLIDFNHNLKGPQLQEGNNIEEDVFDLPNLINFALSRNQDTKKAWLNMQVANYQLKESEAVFYPKLSVGADYNYGRGDSPIGNGKYDTNRLNAQVNVGYNSLNIGRAVASVKSLQNALNMVKYEENIVIRDLLFSVVEKYYNILSLKAKVVAALETERLYFESYEAAAMRHKIGLVPLVDKLKAESSYSQSKLERYEAERDLAKEEAALNSLLNLEPQHKIRLLVPDLKVNITDYGNVNELIQMAYNNRIELKQLLEERKKLTHDLKAAQANRHPSLSLTGQYSYTYAMENDANRGTNNGSLGVGISLPIFSGFDVTNIIRQRKKDLEILDTKEEQLKREIELEVWNAHQDFKTSGENYKTSEDLLKSARESAKITLGMYKNGKSSILDLLDSQSQLASAKIASINSKHEFIINRIKLLKVVDRISVENIINLETM